jgi:hypothetical protein
LGKKALAEIATIAQPETILAWHRRFVVELADDTKHGGVGSDELLYEPGVE